MGVVQRIDRKRKVGEFHNFPRPVFILGYSYRNVPSMEKITRRRQYCYVVCVSFTCFVALFTFYYTFLRTHERVTTNSSRRPFLLVVTWPKPVKIVTLCTYTESVRRHIHARAYPPRTWYVLLLLYYCMWCTSTF